MRVLIDEIRVYIARHKLRMLENVEQERNIGLYIKTNKVTTLPPEAYFLSHTQTVHRRLRNKAKEDILASLYT